MASRASCVVQEQERSGDAVVLDFTNSNISKCQKLQVQALTHSWTIDFFHFHQINVTWKLKRVSQYLLFCTVRLQMHEKVDANAVPSFFMDTTLPPLVQSTKFSEIFQEPFTYMPL